MRQEFEGSPVITPAASIVLRAHLGTHGTSRGGVEGGSSSKSSKDKESRREEEEVLGSEGEVGDRGSIGG